jgi:hypothetical protein
MELEAVSPNPVCGSAAPVVALIELALEMCRAARGWNNVGTPEAIPGPGDCASPNGVGNNASTSEAAAVLRARRTVQKALRDRVIASHPVAWATPSLWSFRKGKERSFFNPAGRGLPQVKCTGISWFPGRPRGQDYKLESFGLPCYCFITIASHRHWDSGNSKN